MNRRNFFKTVTGFVAGVFATSAIAKEKPKLTVAMLQKAKKELECEWWGEIKCSGQNGTLCPRCKFNTMEQLRIEAALKAVNPPLVFNPNVAAYTTHESGNIEFIHYKDFHKTKNI